MIPSQSEKARSKRKFKINVSILAGGTGLAQLIVVISSPLITRLYTPEEFGILAAFLSVTTTVAIFSTLSYEFAALIPDDDAEAINIILLAIVAGVFTSAIIGMIVISNRAKIAALLDHAALSEWLLLFPLAVFLLCVQQTFRMWWNRQQRYTINAVSGIVQAIVDNVVKIGAALTVHAGSKGLLAGYLVGIAAADTMLLAKVRYLGKQGILRTFNVGKMAALGKRFIAFPLYNCWADLICCSYLNLPALLLALLFDSHVAGLYAITNRVLKTPARIIGLSVSQVLFNEVSRRRNRHLRIYPLISKVFWMVLVFIAVPMVVGVTLSKDLFGAILGSRWADSGQYAAVMMPWIGMQLVAVSVSSVYPATENNKINAMVQIVRLLSVLCPLITSYYAGLDAIDSLSILSTTNLLANLLLALVPLFLAYRYDAAHAIDLATGNTNVLVTEDKRVAPSL